MDKTWRQIASPIIARVIAENRAKGEKALRAALRAAYPFGERQYHPYKIWCDEVNAQLGRKKPKPKPTPAPAIPRDMPLFD